MFPPIFTSQMSAWGFSQKPLIDMLLLIIEIFSALCTYCVNKCTSTFKRVSEHRSLHPLSQFYTSNSIPTSYTNTNPHHAVSTCFSHAVYSQSPRRLVWDTLLSSASISCCPKSSAGLPFILNKHTTPRQSSVARHFIQTHTSTTH